MRRIVTPTSRWSAEPREALALMKDEPYKQELINDLPENAHISFYRQGSLPTSALARTFPPPVR